MGTLATLPLLEALNHRNITVRLGAIEALGTIRDRRCCKALIYLLEKDANAEVRWVAALAIGRLGSPDAFNPLVRALKDRDRYVRYGAGSGTPGVVMGSPKRYRPCVSFHCLSGLERRSTDRSRGNRALN